jgi:hypothetical protein
LLERDALALALGLGAGRWKSKDKVAAIFLNVFAPKSRNGKWDPPSSGSAGTLPGA